MSDVLMHFAPQPIPDCDLLAGVTPLRAEVLAAAARVVDSRWYIPRREFETFDQEFAKLHGGAVAIGVANGTAALCLALKDCGLEPGNAAVTVSRTAVSTIAALGMVVLSLHGRTDGWCGCVQPVPHQESGGAAGRLDSAVPGHANR